jgi:hypothetical protein
MGVQLGFGCVSGDTLCDDSEGEAREYNRGNESARGFIPWGWPL